MGQGTPAQEHPVVGPAIQKWILPCPQSALCLSHAKLASVLPMEPVSLGLLYAQCGPCPPLSRCQCRELH